MNITATLRTWSQADSLPVMAAMPDDEFAAFLDMDHMEDLDLDFPIFDNGSNTQHNVSVPEPASTAHQHTTAPSCEFASSEAYQVAAQQQQQLSPALESAYRQVVTGDMDFSQQHPHDNQQNQFSMMTENLYQPHPSVPPTPNSAQMYPDPALYLQQMDSQIRDMMESQYHHYSKDITVNPTSAQLTGELTRLQQTLTPMISPEMSANENGLSFLPQYAVPASYSLSPLNSPAMNPQDHLAQSNNPAPRTAISSLAASPIDCAFDLEGDLSSSLNERPRKSRRRIPATPPSACPSAASHRRGGSTNLRRRRGSISSRSIIQDSSLKLHQAQQATNTQSQHVAQQFTAPNTREGTLSKSISPAPLSEPLMAPPPKPTSSTSTPIVCPVINPAQPEASLGSAGDGPVTPASLMKILSKSSPVAMSIQTGDSDQSRPLTRGPGSSMEDLRLPEAATSTAQNTPRIPSRNSSHCGNSQTAVKKPASMLVSPPDSTKGTKAEGKGGRALRKLNSISSAIPSPALRPKISPSLRPQLPEASRIMDETHALILATKSNYQNILEGNNVPGVTYPNELSINLSSKRTSHKIAEQGRRNRMNIALQEMQTLLPGPFGAAAAGDLSHEDGVTSGSPTTDEKQCTNGVRTPATPTTAGNSKAATVEQAIDYIKFLKAECEGKNELAAELERVRGEMRVLQEKL